MSEQKTIGDIVRASLIAMGADGLCSDWSECGCELEDLAPGGDCCDVMNCEPAHKQTCSADLPEEERCEFCTEGLGWHMVKIKKRRKTDGHDHLREA